MLYRIVASEVVYYELRVEAESEEDAVDMADQFANDFVAFNNSGYQIDSVKLIEEEKIG
jgi:capsular polysaccharide biosynthesis protein